MPAVNASQAAVVEALAAVLLTVIVVVAGLIAWKQAREAQRARYLGVIIRIFDDLGSREAFEDADAALGLPARIEEYTPEEWELATWTARVFEKVAFLVESGMIPAGSLIPLYSRRIVWTWDALQPFIQEQRRLRDGDGAYRANCDGRYFESLVQRAVIYRSRKFSDTRRARPPVPVAYRERVRAMIARGERLGSGGYRG